MASTILMIPLSSLSTIQYQINFDGTNTDSGISSEANVKSRTYESNFSLRRKMRNLSKKDKVILRRIKNNEAAKASREKAKHKEKFLEQRLVDLQYEKMKLLLEQEALTKQNEELFTENLNLKKRVHNRKFSVNDENKSGSTFRQAEGVGSFQDFHHPHVINMEVTKSNICDVHDSSYKKFEKSIQNPKFSDPVSVSLMEVDDASLELPSNFSLVEWLNNSEDDYIGDKIFSSLELNHCLRENGKSAEDSNASLLEEQILQQELECYKELEGFFEKCEEDTSKLEPNVEMSRIRSISVENYSNDISRSDKINETFIELPKWTFDNLYEEIN